MWKKEKRKIVKKSINMISTELSIINTFILYIKVMFSTLSTIFYKQNVIKLLTSMLILLITYIGPLKIFIHYLLTVK